MSSRRKPARNKGPVPTRVVIVEDQRLLAEYFAQHCAQMGLQVVARAETLDAGKSVVRREKPDLLLLDFGLPDGDGLEAARELMAELPEMRVLGISSHRDAWTMLQVQRIGLHGFIDKQEQQPGRLSEAIRAVLEDRVHYAPVVNDTTASLRRDPRAFFRLLSDYEVRVLSLIGESKTDHEIADLLQISSATVQSRRRDIMRKLDVHSTPKLIHYAISHGVTRPEQLSKGR